MAQEEQVARLTSLLSTYQAFVTYQPLRTEVAFAQYVELPVGTPVFEIPPRAGVDPLEEAVRASTFGKERTVILIPGRTFDASGTRLGQGGGWYDRFLAKVPRAWLRIGFCYDDQFSETPLRRESWDQAMDIVVVVNRKTNEVTVYSAEGIHD